MLEERDLLAATISTVAGGGVSMPGFGGNGAPATNAALSSPEAVAVNGSGDLFIADSGNSIIREVSPSGIITTIAGNGTSGFSDEAGPGGVTIPTNGNTGFSGDGGPATNAQLPFPEAVAVDGGGDLFIAASGNNVIREVSTSGIITTIAGNGTSGFSGDGGPATNAQLELSLGGGLAVDRSGDVFIADSGNNRIRKVTGIPTLAARQTGVGAFDRSTGMWYLRSEPAPGAPDVGAFPYGAPGWIPLVGDWNGDGTTTVGAVDPTSATWYLRNENSAGGADAVTNPVSVGPQSGPFQFGAPGWIPVGGDWNGSGSTGIGMVDPSTGTWYLREEDSAGRADAGVFQFGAPGWIPIVGDWTGSGHTGIGAVDPSTGTWYLRNEVSTGAPDAGVFPFGLGTWQPVTGLWSLSAPTPTAALVSAPPAALPANQGLLASSTSTTPMLPTRGAEANDSVPNTLVAGPWQRVRALDAIFSGI